jgi:AraC-like DNA-binding protein
MSLPFRMNMWATDPAEAHAWFGEVYMPYTVRLSGNADEFHACHAEADFNGFSAILLDHRVMSAEMDATPTDDFLLVVRPLAGEFSVASEGQEIVANPGEYLVINPDAPFQIREKDVRLSMLRFDRDALERAAADLTGEDSRQPLRFPLARPLSHSSGRRWQNLVENLAYETTDDGTAPAGPLVATQSLRLVTAALLETFPNSALAHDPGSTGVTHEHALRRAVTFIEDSAHENIGVDQIAEAARLSPRGLHFAFRSRLATTPLAFLNRVRLEHAHLELRQQGFASGTTVTEIARRWGFPSAARFVAEYRQRYGYTPFHTLRA